MLPHEPEAVVGFAMGDATVVDDGVFSNTDAVLPDQKDKDEDAADIEEKQDVISFISEANSTKRNKSKKRVQFLPDGMLERVREIPPRSNKSSSESDGSASESDSGSDSDSDSDSASESEDPSDRDTPTPPVQTVSETKFTTMPPLVWNPSAAKGSYNVTKQSAKQGSLVAKITGIHRPTSPSSTQTHTSTPKVTQKKTRRTPSPRTDKRPKRVGKQTEKNGTGKISPDTQQRRPKAPKKHVPTKKDGKTSPPPNPKPSKAHPTPSKSTMNPKLSLAQRRINSAPPNKISAAKRNRVSTISTSVTVLPTTSEPCSIIDTSTERVTRAMQSLSVGQLYTVDGFIFPSHQASDLHLPEVLHINGRRGSSESLPPSPRKMSDQTGSVTGDHNHYHMQQQPTQQLSPQSANRKRRYYAWQMANGSIQNTLHNTPSIAQLWDNVPPSSSGDPFIVSSLKTSKNVSSSNKKT